MADLSMGDGSHHSAAATGRVALPLRAGLSFAERFHPPRAMPERKQGWLRASLTQSSLEGSGS